MQKPPMPSSTREESQRRELRSRVIAWGLVGLALLFFLGTGIRLGGASPSLSTLVSGTAVIVGVLMPGLLFTLPLTIAWGATALMAAGTAYVWVGSGQPLQVKIVALILTLVVLVQMVLRSRAARAGSVGDQ